MSNVQVSQLEAQIAQLKNALKEAKSQDLYAGAEYVVTRDAYTDDRGNTHPMLKFTLTKNGRAIGKPISMGKSKIRAIIQAYNNATYKQQVEAFIA